MVADTAQAVLPPDTTYSHRFLMITHITTRSHKLHTKRRVLEVLATILRDCHQLISPMYQIRALLGLLHLSNPRWFNRCIILLIVEEHRNRRNKVTFIACIPAALTRTTTNDKVIHHCTMHLLNIKMTDRVILTCCDPRPQPIAGLRSPKVTSEKTS